MARDQAAFSRAIRQVAASTQLHPAPKRAELLLGVDWTDPKRGGYTVHTIAATAAADNIPPEKTSSDRACFHDACYTASGVTYRDSFSLLLSFTKANAIRGCNQAIRNAASQLSGEGPTRVRQFYTYGRGGFYGCKKE